jgi:hypothetical protein
MKILLTDAFQGIFTLYLASIHEKTYLFFIIFHFLGKKTIKLYLIYFSFDDIKKANNFFLAFFFKLIFSRLWC